MNFRFTNTGDSNKMSVSKKDVVALKSDFSSSFRSLRQQNVETTKLVRLLANRVTENKAFFEGHSGHNEDEDEADDGLPGKTMTVLEITY